ncbi:MAG: hypothetical protein U0271_04410 [Polyangiaceae bacterium]
MSFRFDSSKSQITIETRAKGMLAKLAHDLSIIVRSYSVTPSVQGGRVSVELRAQGSSLEVDGVRKSGHLDRSVLSAGDKSDIHKRIRDDLFQGQDLVARLEADGDGWLEAADVSRDVELTGAVSHGRASQRVSVRARLESTAAQVVVNGTLRLSLPSLGMTPPKGPLGAFRVDDELEVVFRLHFAREAA